MCYDNAITDEFTVEFTDEFTVEFAVEFNVEFAVEFTFTFWNHETYCYLLCTENYANPLIACYFCALAQPENNLIWPFASFKIIRFETLYLKIDLID